MLSVSSSEPVTEVKKEKKSKKRKLQSIEHHNALRSFVIDGPQMTSHVEDLGESKSNLPNADFESYFDRKLNATEKDRYKAAGIVFFRKTENGFEILLGQKAKKDKAFSLLGGKRERLESPVLTACRELYEELGGLMDSTYILRLRDLLQCEEATADSGDNENAASDLAKQVLWVEFGLYVLYIIPITALDGLADEIERTCQRFNEHTSTRAWNVAPKAFREMLSLKWVKISSRSSENALHSENTAVTPSLSSSTLSSSSVSLQLLSSSLLSSGQTTQSIDLNAVTQPTLSLSHFTRHCLHSKAFIDWLTILDTKDSRSDVELCASIEI